jgi:hypothetical protein
MEKQHYCTQCAPWCQQLNEPLPVANSTNSAGSAGLQQHNYTQFAIAKMPVAVSGIVPIAAGPQQTTMCYQPTNTLMMEVQTLFLLPAATH